MEFLAVSWREAVSAEAMLEINETDSVSNNVIRKVFLIISNFTSQYHVISTLLEFQLVSPQNKKQPPRLGSCRPWRYKTHEIRCMLLTRHSKPSNKKANNLAGERPKVNLPSFQEWSRDGFLLRVSCCFSCKVSTYLLNLSYRIIFRYIVLSEIALKIDLSGLVLTSMIQGFSFLSIPTSMPNERNLGNMRPIWLLTRRPSDFSWFS